MTSGLCSHPPLRHSLVQQRIRVGLSERYGLPRKKSTAAHFFTIVAAQTIQVRPDHQSLDAVRRLIASELLYLLSQALTVIIMLTALQQADS